MACLYSLQYHLTMSADRPSIAAGGLEPTPIDPCRIVTVKKVPLDSSPLWKIVDKGFLATLCDILRSDGDISSTTPGINLLPSSLKLTPLTADEVESMMRQKVRKIDEPSSKNPEGIALWSEDGIRKLRNMEVMVSDRDSEHSSSSSSRTMSSNASQTIPCCCSPESSCSTFTVQQASSFMNSVTFSENQRGETAAMFRRINQSQQWYQQYLEMVKFRELYGHCLVPLSWPANPSLANWVKRQRYQYRAKQERKHSTLTKERQELLEKLGFVWDSHASGWEERWNELREFKQKYGHCRVPKTYAANRQLAIWVKCQRRQFKLYNEGKDSNITKKRIDKLASLGFVFTPRKPKT